MVFVRGMNLPATRTETTTLESRTIDGMDPTNGALTAEHVRRVTQVILGQTIGG